MKRYAAMELQPGMILGQPLYNHHRQLVLEAGMVLDESMIDRINYYGIYEVLIEEPKEVSEATPEDVKSSPVVEEAPEDEKSSPVTEEKSAQSRFTYINASQSRAQKLLRTPQFRRFQMDYTQEIHALRGTLSSILEDSDKALNTEELLNSVDNLVRHSPGTLDLFDSLFNMRQMSDSIYSHSINVSMIARLMGKWLKLSPEDLQVLTLCGLLHDVGKTALPIELLDKTSRYTPEEFDQVKRHPALGFQLLKDRDIDIRIKKAALMHHERCDGSGYPQGLTTDQTDDFAMIIAIADVYDAMTAARSYRKPLCPFQVIDAVEKDGLQKYHPKYILTFFEHIADTYRHNRILLNNGQSGTVVMINKTQLSRPYVQLADNTVIDLSERRELEIVSVL